MKLSLDIKAYHSLQTDLHITTDSMGSSNRIWKSSSVKSVVCVIYVVWIWFFLVCFHVGDFVLGSYNRIWELQPSLQLFNLHVVDPRPKKNTNFSTSGCYDF